VGAGVSGNTDKSTSQLVENEDKTQAKSDKMSAMGYILFYPDHGHI